MKKTTRILSLERFGHFILLEFLKKMVIDNFIIS